MKNLADKITNLVTTTNLHIKQAVITNLPMSNYTEDLLKVITFPVIGTHILIDGYDGNDYIKFLEGLKNIRLESRLWVRYTGIIWLSDNTTWIERLHTNPLINWEVKSTPIFPIINK